MSQSPATPKFRKRHSSDSSDGSIPEKRPTPERLPCSENEIRYLANPPLDHRPYPYSPSAHQGKPVAMVSPIAHSPITNSVRKVPLKLQVCLVLDGDNYETISYHHVCKSEAVSMMLLTSAQL